MSFSVCFAVTLKCFDIGSSMYIYWHYLLGTIVGSNNANQIRIVCGESASTTTDMAAIFSGSKPFRNQIHGTKSWHNSFGVHYNNFLAKAAGYIPHWPASLHSRYFFGFKGPQDDGRYEA